MKTKFCKPSTHSAARGFTFIEVLVVTACLSTLTCVGLVTVQTVQEAGMRSKLESDIATLNQSVRIYAGNGGALPKSANASEALDRLKTKVTAADAPSIVGHTGPFLDPRVKGVSISKKGALRAVWDGKAMRFVLDTKGQGFSKLVVDDTLATKAVKTESRQTVEKFAKRDAWVWDYDANVTAAPKATPADAAIAAATPVVLAPQQGAPGPGQLQPPIFSVPPGLYDYATFPMPVQLTDPNPKGSSRILYSVNNGRWAVYTPGTPLNLPKDQLNTTLQTYAAPLNGEEWIDSSSATGLYQTIFFKGSTSGLFHDPKGDAFQVTNLPNGLKLKTFTWGVPVPGSSKNSLDFAGVSSFFALPEQEFKIGDLTYVNGTTYAGTNSKSVEMEVALQLTVPQALERLDFTVKLQSTPNLGKDQNVDADYVWIPHLSSKFSTTVQGQTFYLRLRFGQPTVSSFTTIDEFHVFESKSARGAIYGTLTTKPAAH